MIGIVFIGDLIYCPYLKKYTEVLDKENKKYEVLYWNRGDILNSYPQNYISYKKVSKLNRKPFFKITDFLSYKIWLEKMISKKKYSKLIILTTLSGIILAKTLLKEYKGKYIFDIRDYSYENNKIFYSIEEKLIFNSFFTCISSEGFKNFLPKNYPYVIAHNFNKNELKQSKMFKKQNYGSVLNIVWLGSLRYFDHQVKIINNLKNDNRFNLIFHGSGPDYELYRKYCKENKIQNATLTGKFNIQDKRKLLENANILNNSYDSYRKMEVKYAIPNRYYDGLIYGIPQLIEVGTYKYTKVIENNLGIGIDINSPTFGDTLYEYYFAIDEDNFNLSCDIELNKILQEDLNYIHLIHEFIHS